ncbi:hypothetical protein HJG60_011104 [Phyllostomus discolor]|uniref:Uncharacterized protein n=1 Tax=Phyllostomus discolor TaxID=89673 RepID=A0A834A1T4_9CHIR|nr:hypothetical protein HJG60_011104 [Phyllostomus discolor]
MQAQHPHPLPAPPALSLPTPADPDRHHQRVASRSLGSRIDTGPHPLLPSPRMRRMTGRRPPTHTGTHVPPPQRCPGLTCPRSVLTPGQWPREAGMCPLPSLQKRPLENVAEAIPFTPRTRPSPSADRHPLGVFRAGNTQWAPNGGRFRDRATAERTNDGPWHTPSLRCQRSAVSWASGPGAHSGRSAAGHRPGQHPRPAWSFRPPPTASPQPKPCPPEGRVSRSKDPSAAPLWALISDSAGPGPGHTPADGPGSPPSWKSRHELDPGSSSSRPQKPCAGAAHFSTGTSREKPRSAGPGVGDPGQVSQVSQVSQASQVLGRGVGSLGPAMDEEGAGTATPARPAPRSPRQSWGGRRRP